MKKLILACAPLVFSVCMHTVSAAEIPPAPVSRCAGTIGTDYPWPAFSNSWEVNLLRERIIFALKSSNGFEGPPEHVVPIDPAGTSVTLPTGWIIAMDAVSPTTQREQPCYPLARQHERRFAGRHRRAVTVALTTRPRKP